MFYNINSSFELKESLLYVAENEESYSIEESEKLEKIYEKREIKDMKFTKNMIKALKMHWQTQEKWRFS